MLTTPQDIVNSTALCYRARNFVLWHFALLPTFFNEPVARGNLNEEYICDGRVLAFQGVIRCCENFSVGNDSKNSKNISFAFFVMRHNKTSSNWC